MSDQIKDQLKSFVLGIAFPLALAFLALSYMDGAEHRFGRAGHVLTPIHAFGRGLWQLGIAVCTHAIFYGRYENYPRIKVGVLTVGVVSFFVGLYMRLN
jgi:hypothetical protein